MKDLIKALFVFISIILIGCETHPYEPEQVYSECTQAEKSLDGNLDMLGNEKQCFKESI